jgi:hypothetical protein
VLHGSSEVVFLDVGFAIDFVHDLLIFGFGLGPQIGKVLVVLNGQTLVADLNALLVFLQPK